MTIMFGFSELLKGNFSFFFLVVTKMYQISVHINFMVINRVTEFYNR